MPKRLTLDKFVEKANLVHNNKYDYSQVEYINNRCKVRIICPKHGEFSQSPLHHLGGKGCAKCMSEKLRKCFQLTKQKFIEKCVLKHGLKYDYSLVEYINAHTKVKIVCPKHGEFIQEPNSHINGNGCPKCAIENSKCKLTMTKEEFVCRATIIHGNIYDYSLAIYKNNKTKTRIVCKKHGDFWQLPNSHLAGHGCPKCGNIQGKKYNENNRKWFIDEILNIFDVQYDFSKSALNGKNKIEVICPIHGSFFQFPHNLLYGHGCPQCGRQRSKEKKALTKEQFMRKARQVHNDFYNYDSVIYVNSQQSIMITCPIHGNFWQKSNNHLNGQGCKRCAHSNKSKNADRWLASLNIDLEREFPILTCNGFHYVADGFDVETNTIYEYFGNFWHGNPEIYDRNSINPKNGITFGELYDNTLTKINNLQLDGYHVIYKWGK